MKKNPSTKLLLAFFSLSLLIGGWSSSAFAAIMTVPALAPISTAPTDWVNTLQFPKFDPALGTLISMELDLTATLNTTITITNNSTTDGSSGMANTRLQLKVQDAGALLSVPQIVLESPVYHYGGDPNPTSSTLLPASQSVSSAQTNTPGTSSNIYTSGPVLAEFTGTGNINLTASTLTGTLLTNNGGSTSSSQSSTASANGTVVYTFNPVPEPTTATLLGTACLGFAASRRRRKV